MKAKILRFLAAIGLLLAAVATLDLSAFTDILPPEYQAKALAIGLMLPAIKELVFIVGDLADDGKRNGSWVPILTALLAVGALLSLPACSVHLGADGSKDASIDGAGAAQAVLAVGKVIADKP